MKKASQLLVIVLAALVDEEPGDVADGDDGAEAGADVVLVPLLHAARPPPMAETRRIQETNLRVFTQTFSSFPVSLAMLFLTLTSARQRTTGGGTNGPPRRSEFPWGALAGRAKSNSEGDIGRRHESRGYP